MKDHDCAPCDACLEHITSPLLKRAINTEEVYVNAARRVVQLEDALREIVNFAPDGSILSKMLGLDAGLLDNARAALSNHSPAGEGENK